MKTSELLFRRGDSKNNISNLSSFLINRKVSGKPSQFHQFFFGNRLRIDKDKDGIPFGMDCNDRNFFRDAPIIPQALQQLRPVAPQTVAQYQLSKMSQQQSQQGLSQEQANQIQQAQTEMSNLSYEDYFNKYQNLPDDIKQFFTSPDELKQTSEYQSYSSQKAVYDAQVAEVDAWNTAQIYYNNGMAPQPSMGRAGELLNQFYRSDQYATQQMNLAKAGLNTNPYYTQKYEVTLPSEYTSTGYKTITGSKEFVEKQISNYNTLHGIQDTPVNVYSAYQPSGILDRLFGSSRTYQDIKTEISDIGTNVVQFGKNVANVPKTIYEIYNPSEIRQMPYVGNIPSDYLAKHPNELTNPSPTITSETQRYKDMGYSSYNAKILAQESMAQGGTTLGETTTSWNTPLGGEHTSSYNPTLIKYGREHPIESAVGNMFFGVGSASLEQDKQIQTEQQNKQAEQQYIQETSYGQLIKESPSRAVRKGFGEAGETLVKGSNVFFNKLGIAREQEQKYYDSLGNRVFTPPSNTSKGKAQTRAGEYVGDLLLGAFFSPVFATGSYGQGFEEEENAFSFLSPKKKSQTQQLLGENKFSELGIGLDEQANAGNLIYNIKQDLIEKNTFEEQMQYLSKLRNKLTTDKAKTNFDVFVKQELKPIIKPRVIKLVQEKNIPSINGQPAKAMLPKEETLFNQIKDVSSRLPLQQRNAFLKNIKSNMDKGTLDNFELFMKGNKVVTPATINPSGEELVYIIKHAPKMKGAGTITGTSPNLTNYFETKTQTKTETKQIVSENPLFNFHTNQKEETQQKNPSSLLTPSLTQQRTRQEERTQQPQKEVPLLFFRQLLREPEKPRQQERNKQPQPQKPRELPTPTIPLTIFGFGFIFGNEKQQQKKEQAWFGYALKDTTKGKPKWVKVTNKPATKQAAVDIAARFVDENLSARWKVEPAKHKIEGKDKLVMVEKQKLQQPTGYYKSREYKFRTFQQRKGVRTKIPNQGIELQKFRLDSPGEKKNIQKAKKEMSVRNFFGM